MAEDSRLARVDGLWVHQGNPDPGANWEGILEEVRLRSEDRAESQDDRVIHYVVNWSEEDQCYIGRCPNLFLGGVHGDDPEKVFKEIRELAAWVIETQPGLLKDLLEGITSENQQPPTDFGPATGEEVW